MSEDGEAKTCKVVLLGESGVGKTCIISRYTNNTFEENIMSTTGASYCGKAMTFDEYGGKTIKFEIWDTAGQERYRALTKMFYKNAIAAVIVYDITRKRSFEEINTFWIKQIKESAPENIILAIAANKADLLDKEEVNEKEARKFAEDNNALFFETSAKSGLGLNELFVGIGKKYYGFDSDIQVQEEIIGNEKSDDKLKDENTNNNNNNYVRNGSIIINNQNANNNKTKKGCC